MTRRQNAILLLLLILIGLPSFVYSSQALADLTVFYPTSGQALGAELILQPELSPAMTDADLELSLLDTHEIIRQRLALLEAQPYYITIQDGGLRVTLPDSENMSYISHIIAHVGQIEFIDGGLGVPPLGHRIKTGQQPNAVKGIYQTLFSGPEVHNITPPDLGAGQIFYQLTLTPRAAARFTDFIESESNHYICLVLDQEVISCSKMYHWSANTLEILPNLSSGSLVSMADVALFLKSGPLPVSMRVKQR